MKYHQVPKVNLNASGDVNRKRTRISLLSLEYAVAAIHYKGVTIEEGRGNPSSARDRITWG